MNVQPAATARDATGTIAFARYPKQFVIAERPVPIAGAENRAEAFGLSVQTAPAVPLTRVEGPDGVLQALIIGWWIHDGHLARTNGTLRVAGDFAADVFPEMAGRFLFVGRDALGPYVHLDAGGFLGAVYDPERRVVAATATLVARLFGNPVDEAVAGIFRFPARRGFLPFGLTAHEGVARLLPNHRLRLDAWMPERAWPDPGLAAAPCLDAETARGRMPELAARVEAQVAATIQDGRVHLYLSGGHDSRIVLAALARHREAVRAETLHAGRSADLHVARAVAARMGVAHEAVPIERSTPEEIAAWLDRTGHTFYDPLTDLGRTAERIDRGGLPIDGTGAEIMRASNWAPEDLATADLDLPALLARLRLPAAPAILRAGRAWLDGLPPADATTLLDIAKIEQIHACWSGVTAYGHMTERPSLSPFASRRIFEAALKFPKAYKAGNRFYADFVSLLCPELLDVPANRVTGLARLLYPHDELKRLIPSKIKRLIKPLR